MAATMQQAVALLLIVAYLTQTAQSASPRRQLTQVGSGRAGDTGDGNTGNDAGEANLGSTSFRGTSAAGDDCNVPNAGIGVPLYLATLNGLVAVTPNNTLYVPAPSADAQAGLFVLDAKGTVVKPCISVVFIKTVSTNRYCRFSEALLASLISGVNMQGLVCDLPTVSNATAFIYQGNQLTFMQLRLAVSTQGQVVFGQQNETVAPVVPVAPALPNDLDSSKAAFIMTPGGPIAVASSGQASLSTRNVSYQERAQQFYIEPVNRSLPAAGLRLRSAQTGQYCTLSAGAPLTCSEAQQGSATVYQYTAAGLTVDSGKLALAAGGANVVVAPGSGTDQSTMLIVMYPELLALVAPASEAPNKSGTIAAAVIGSIAGVALLAFFGYYVLKYRRDEDDSDSDDDDKPQAVQQGGVHIAGVL